MISFDFEYYKPDTIQEAVKLFQELSAQGKHPMYYAGGTEIISLGRMNEIFTQAVIDIKALPECNVLTVQDNQLVIGAAVTLAQISESKLFPLLGDTVARIADHTNQCKITLGGNLNAKIVYRESVLPLLLSDSRLVIAGADGFKQVNLSDVFAEKLKLQSGELLVQMLIDKSFASLPYYHAKKTKIDKIDYPLVTIAALKKGQEIRLALSGVCEFPFRSNGFEQALNNKNFNIAERIEMAFEKLPGPILNDIIASPEYRKFVVKNTITEAMTQLEGMM